MISWVITLVVESTALVQYVATPTSTCDRTDDLNRAHTSVLGVKPLTICLLGYYPILESL